MSGVLFIDDDVLSLQIMSEATALLGYQAMTSTSACNALALAAREKPALILVDMQMDEMSGTDFVRQVRCSPEIAHVPVYICSASMAYTDAEKAKNAGADGFLQKPLVLNSLSRVFHSYLA